MGGSVNLTLSISNHLNIKCPPGYHDDPMRVGFENQNVCTWVGLVLEPAYISGLVLQKMDI